MTTCEPPLVRPLRPSEVDGSDPGSPIVPLSPEEVDELRPDAITRADGYRRARGKEGPALELAKDFFDWVGLEPTDITEPYENYRCGDLRFPRNTVEVKGQPIDPNRYNRNFIEVFEDTTALERPHHADGFARTAEILRMDVDDLAAVPVTYYATRDPVGHVAYASASLTPIDGSFATVYINAIEQFLYLYSSKALLRLVRRAVLTSGFVRGKGNSNEDTLAVFIPISSARWQCVEGKWTFLGRPGAEDEILGALRGRLGAPK